MARKRLRAIKQQQLEDAKKTEAKEVKKPAGKSVRQSGDWFQRNKSLITWALAIAFASTCIGIAGIVFIFGGGENQETKKPPEQQAIDDIMQNIKYWNDRVGNSPDDASALANLGFAYQEAANKLQAKVMGSALKPEDKKKYDEYLDNAEQNYEKALKIDSTYAFALTNLADIYLLKKKNKEVITLLNDFAAKFTAAENNPASPVPGSTTQNLSDVDKNVIHEKLCYAYFQSAEFEKAIREGEIVLKSDPGNFNVYISLAKSYDSLHNPSKALDYAQNAKLVGIDRMQYTNDMQERLNIYQKTMEIQELQNKILDEYMNKGEYAEAINAADKLLQDDPTDFETQLFAARAFNAMKNYDQALARLDLIKKQCDEFKKSPGQTSKLIDDVVVKVGTMQGEIYSEKKEYAKAGEAYNSAKELALANKDEKTAADLEGRLKKLAPHLPKVAPSPKVEKEETTPVPVKTP